MKDSLDLFAFLNLERGIEESATDSDQGAPILTVLGTVGNQGNQFLASRLHLAANLSYFRITCTFKESHDTCMYRIVNVISGLFRRLAILSPFVECFSALLQVFDIGVDSAEFWPNQPTGRTSNLSKHMQ